MKFFIMYLFEIINIRTCALLSLLLMCLLCSFQKRNFKNGGWEVLFDGKNIEKWKSVDTDTFPTNAWGTAGGNLFVKNHVKGADIITREEYTNFELVFEA